MCVYGRSPEESGFLRIVVQSGIEAEERHADGFPCRSRKRHFFTASSVLRALAKQGRGKKTLIAM